MGGVDDNNSLLRTIILVKYFNNLLFAMYRVSDFMQNPGYHHAQ